MSINMDVRWHEGIDKRGSVPGRQPFTTNPLIHANLRLYRVGLRASFDKQAVKQLATDRSAVTSNLSAYEVADRTLVNHRPRVTLVTSVVGMKINKQ